MGGLAQEAERFRSLDVSRFDPEMAERPLLLLDIDGVLNAYRFDPQVTVLPSDGYEDVTEFLVPTDSGRQFRFQVSPTLLGDLAALARSKVVEVAWLTTWQEQANRHVTPVLGLGPFPVAAYNHRPSDYDWKGRAACEALQLRRPLVWVDDTEIGAAERVRFAASGVAHQLIVPDPQVGLTRGDVASIRRFCQSHTT